MIISRQNSSPPEASEGSYRTTPSGIGSARSGSTKYMHSTCGAAASARAIARSGLFALACRPVSASSRHQPPFALVIQRRPFAGPLASVRASSMNAVDRTSGGTCAVGCCDSWYHRPGKWSIRQDKTWRAVLPVNCRVHRACSAR